MWHVLPAIPRVETTDLRNGHITITRALKPGYGNSLIISSCYSLDALRVGREFLVTRKRTPPGSIKLSFWPKFFG